jgi:23S rRNA (uracil1939-C5)-methyltransferase
MRAVDLKIDDVAFGGKGVARHEGKAVFVPFTIDGEKVAAAIVREKKRFAEGEVVEILEPSPNRVPPPCPYFGKCGGCTYQHISYDHQLAIKWRQVRDVLQRIGKLNDLPLRPIICSTQAYGYRNRITVHVEDGIIGFYRRDSHRLMDIERCPISMEAVNASLTELRSSHPRDGHYSLRANPTGPRIFGQANDNVAQALRDLIVRLVPDGQRCLIDAYGGAGFFAKALLGKFDRIIGIDWDRFAIQEAQKNASEKETYITGDVDQVLADCLIDERPLTLIVDPPESGLSDLARSSIINLAPDYFIYVSCNPATLARDLAALQSHFQIVSVTPLDMFPQTSEIEVAVELRKSV